MGLEQLPSGSWRIKKMVNGLRYQVTVDHKPSKLEQERLIAERIQETPINVQNVPKGTFIAKAKEYIELKRNVLSPTTIRGYNVIIRALSDSFLKLQIKDITQAKVQEEINIYSATHSPKSARNAHGFISAVLGMFYPGLMLHTTLPQKAHHERYTPSDSDVEAIMGLAKNSQYYLFFLLAMYGLRRSEIMALEKSDLNGNLLSINKAYVPSDDGWVTKATKTTKSTRDIYISDNIVDMISSMDDGKLFSFNPDSAYAWLSRSEAKLGIPHFGIHRYRHYYASKAHALGIPDSYIMDVCGWESDYVLKQTYRHSMDQERRQMQEKMIAHMNNLF